MFISYFKDFKVKEATKSKRHHYSANYLMTSRLTVQWPFYVINKQIKDIRNHWYLWNIDCAFSGGNLTFYLPTQCFWQKSAKTSVALNDYCFSFYIILLFQKYLGGDLWVDIYKWLSCVQEHFSQWDIESLPLWVVIHGQ